MSDFNEIHERTIAVYETHASGWDKHRTRFLREKSWLNKFVQSLQPGATLLDVLTVIGAVFLVFMGSERMLEFINWITTWPQWGVRLQSTLGVAFGLFLLWSIFSKRADA